MSSSSLPPAGRGYADYLPRLPRIDRSLLAELAGKLRPLCETPVAVAPPEPEPSPARIADPVEAANSRERPTPDELAGALKTVRRAASLMDEFQVHAIPPERFAAIQRDIVKLESRVSDYEREFETIAAELSRAKQETERFRRRSVVAEQKLEALTAAVGRMFATLPAQNATGGGGRGTVS